MKKIESIDSLKGLLILLVIIGHVLVGSYYENIFRYIIYGFHMPLFFIISGYLLNTDVIKSLSITELIKKYLFRVIVPWIIALLVYNLLLYITHQNDRLIYYHLWYIPSFLLSIVLFWSLTKFNVSIKYILLVALLMYFFLYKPVTDQPAIIFHDLRPYHFVFFVFGVFLKKFGLGINIIVTCIVLFVSFIIYIIIRHYPDTNLRPIIFLLLNCSLAALIFYYIKRLPSFNVFDWLGQNSLAIYLWHVLPLMIIKRYIHGTDVYYLLCFLSILLLFISVYFLNKISFIRCYCFGVSNRIKPFKKD